MLKWWQEKRFCIENTTGLSQYQFLYLVLCKLILIHSWQWRSVQSSTDFIGRHHHDHATPTSDKCLKQINVVRDSRMRQILVSRDIPGWHCWNSERNFTLWPRLIPNCMSLKSYNRLLLRHDAVVNVTWSIYDTTIRWCQTEITVTNCVFLMKFVA